MINFLKSTFILQSFAGVHFQISPSLKSRDSNSGNALQQPDVLTAMTFADPWPLKKRRRRGWSLRPPGGQTILPHSSCSFPDPGYSVQSLEEYDEFLKTSVYNNIFRELPINISRTFLKRRKLWKSGSLSQKLQRPWEKDVFFHKEVKNWATILF